MLHVRWIYYKKSFTILYLIIKSHILQTKVFFVPKIDKKLCLKYKQLKLLNFYKKCYVSHKSL